MERDQNTIHFLDELMVKDHKKLRTTVFQKPTETDRNTIHAADSFHPLSLKKGLPLSQFHRLHIICDSEESFEEQSRILFSQFEARGYPHAWLQSAYDKAKVLNRQQLLHKAHKRPMTYFSVKCVPTFSEQSYQIKEIITIYWNILSTDPSLGDI